MGFSLGTLCLESKDRRHALGAETGKLLREGSGRGPNLSSAGWEVLVIAHGEASGESWERAFHPGIVLTGAKISLRSEDLPAGLTLW